MISLTPFGLTFTMVERIEMKNSGADDDIARSGAPATSSEIPNL